MSGVLDKVLVGAALLASILYAVVALAPKSWRAAIGTALRACGLSRLAPKSVAACGGCDNCAPAGADEAAPGAETRIPLSEIGRRRT